MIWDIIAPILIGLFMIVVTIINASLNCVYGLYNGKTEITEITELKDVYDRRSYFLISNPPKNKDDLLCLIYNHFHSFAQIRPLSYSHSYYEENWFNPRDAAKKKAKFYSDHKMGPYTSESYWSDHRKDMLAQISISPERNIQKVSFYKRGVVLLDIKWPWSAEAKNCEN